MEEYLNKLNLELKLRNFSQKTVKAYNSHVSKFLSGTTKKPEDLSSEEIKNYFSFLLDEKDPLTVSQAISSVKFFFIKMFLGRDWIYFIPKDRRDCLKC